MRGNVHKMSTCKYSNEKDISMNQNKRVDSQRACKRLLLCLLFLCWTFFFCHRMIWKFRQLMSRASGLLTLSRVSNSYYPFTSHLSVKKVFRCIYNKYQDRMSRHIKILYVCLLDIRSWIRIKLSTDFPNLPYIFPSSDNIIFLLPHGG